MIRISLLLSIIILKAQAQNYFHFPEIDQFYNQKLILNPAEGNEHKYTALVGNHSYLPPFGNIGHFYSYGTIGFTSDTNRSLFKHSVGALIMKEKEGEYLGRTRFYAVYSYATALNQTWALKAGGYLGVYNYSVASTISTGSISAFAPDGTLGVALHSLRTQISISSNQIFNAPLSQSLPNSFLKRSYNGLFTHQLRWRPFLKQDLHAWVCWSATKNPFAFIQTTLHFGRYISSGIGFKTNQPGIQYLMAINTSESGSHQFKIAGSYFSPLPSPNGIKAPQLEINLIWIH